jgi:tetratricopeptide (TPR) repeat protein
MRHISRRPEEAIEDAKRAVSLDPLSFATRNQLAQSLTWGGQPAAAMAVLEEEVAEDPANFISHWNLGVLKRPTDIDAALLHFETSVSAVDVPLGQASRSVTLRELGRIEEADEIIEQLETRAAGAGYVSPFALAVAYFGKGDFDRGFDWIEQGVENHDFLSLYSRLISQQYGFDDHSRHQAILRRVWADEFPLEREAGT